MSTPRPLTASELEAEGGQVLEIDKDNIVQYAHYGYVYCMLLTKGLNSGRSDDETLISGGGDGTIKLWSLDKSSGGSIKKAVTLENGDDSILAIVLDGKLLYSGRLEGDINVWDLDTHQMIRRIRAHTADVLTLAVSRGLLFSGSANGFAKVCIDRDVVFRASSNNLPSNLTRGMNALLDGKLMISLFLPPLSLIMTTKKSL